MTQKILIASQNAHKIDEIAPVLIEAGFTVTDARSFDLTEPVEDGNTFVNNARIKAKAALEATGMAVLADDSGLVIDNLEGEFPGVDAKPYMESLGGYPQAVADLHQRLNGKPAACHYVCILLVLFPDGREIIATGKVHGTLVTDARGSGTFGYDPWFQIAGRNETFAEISTEEKNKISHRGEALKNLLQQLRQDRELRAVS